MPATFLAPLTSLRFVAAAGVVFFHLQSSFGYGSNTLNFAPAITFFFVLSGFVLTHAYSDLRHAWQWPAFYYSRFTRIWPLHAIVLAAVMALHPWYGAEPLVVLANFLLVQSWGASVGVAMSLNGVAWSISNEAFFYLLFPLVLASRHRFLWWYAATLALVAAVILIGNRLQPISEPSLAASWANFVHIGPPIRFLEFLSGVGVALLYQRRPPPRLKPWVASVMEVVTLGLIVLSLSTYWLGPGYLLLGPVGGNWVVFCASFPVMALAVYIFAAGRGVLSRLLSVRPFVWLGEISFSLYMVHQPLQNTWMVKGWADGSWRPLSLLAYLVTVLLLSALCWALIEVRLRRLLMGGLGKGRLVGSAVKPSVVS